MASFLPHRSAAGVGVRSTPKWQSSVPLCHLFLLMGFKIMICRCVFWTASFGAIHCIFPLPCNIIQSPLEPVTAQRTTDLHWNSISYSHTYATLPGWEGGSDSTHLHRTSSIKDIQVLDAFCLLDFCEDHSWNHRTPSLQFNRTQNLFSYRPVRWPILGISV